MPNDSNSRTYLPNSTWCFVCGEDNDAGIQTRFYVEEGLVKAKLKPRQHHCGYRGMVHGGIVASILDESMGWAAARAIGRMCLTGELTVRYLETVPGDRDLTVVTEVEKANRRLVLATSELTDEAGTVYARATGKFTPMSVEDTLGVDDMLLYRGGEERLFDALRAEHEGKRD